MRITVAPDLELDARPGATVRDVVATSASEGATLPTRPWCGDVRLDPDHAVGAWPLLDGALLSADRSPACAPPRGVVVRAIAGPDAGRWATLADGAATIGRDDSCALRLDDPALSRIHAAIEDRAPRVVVDRSSTNGTWRRRGVRRRAVARRTELRAGDAIELGRSLVVVEDPSEVPPAAEEPADAASLKEALGRRIAPLAGSLGMGAMMAAMTGRWWILLVGLAYPAITVGPLLANARRPRHLPLDIDAIPSALPGSRAFWTERRGTIAVVGEAESARGVARAVVLARGRAPAGDGWTEPWMAWLPPAGSDDATVVVAADAAPSWAETVVRVEGEETRVESGGRVRSTRAARVSARAADAWARAIAGASGESALPATARLDDVAGEAPAATRSAGRPRSLAAAIGASSSGALVLDLDAHGPHLVVAGTTGSGKSALLETLVLALAERHGPDDLAIALIDFKGGAGLGACMTLPHVVGTLTDLDPHLARRALAALADEIAARKARLREAGHASFHDWESAGGAPARLLVVVDEYQELVALYREFLPDLARLAAQGRSLGLHLVLATQRPAGAVTPEVRANVGSTIALRVASEPESRDLVGSRDAADIPRSAPGRAILASGGERTTFQTALPFTAPTPPVSRVGAARGDPDASALAARVREKWAGRPADSLWLPPLPARLTASDRPDALRDAIWLGRGDVPADRSQPDCAWRPSDGPLVVVGPAGSGRTTTLETVASQARRAGRTPVWLPDDAREAARTIALVREVDDALLLVDDAARATSALAEVDRGRAYEALLDLLARGRPVALALPPAGPPRLAAHAAVRVVLSGADPADEAVWSVPRPLQGIPRAPGRAAVGEGARWMEAQIADLGATTRVPLVATLPTDLAAEALPGGLVDGRVPVGIGGDAAEVVGIDPGERVLVVGDAVRDRSAVAEAIERLGARCGVAIDATDLGNPLATPRREIETSTIVVASPTPRLVADVFPGDTSGLVDPRPARGRVVIVAAGEAYAAQLATP